MKYSKYLLILFIIGVLMTLSILFLSNTDSKDMDNNKVQVMTMSVSVEVPKEVEFCEKKIKLDRLDMYQRFDRELNAFTYLHSSTLLLIKRANCYFPVIEPILKQNGIPEDFKYLAVIESNLDVRAISSAKAAGLWQFMPDTGKKYGLEINDQVDERYHVEKSTIAACQYLKEAYQKYGDWPTVAASYNGGMARISNELAYQKVNSAFDLLLVEETSRYIFRILAAKEIFSNPYKYGFILRKENLYPTVKIKEVIVTEDVVDFADFAQKYDINYAQLKTYNAWLRDRKLIIPKGGKTYKIAIPLKENLYYNKDNIKVHDKAWIVDN